MSSRPLSIEQQFEQVRQRTAEEVATVALSYSFKGKNTEAQQAAVKWAAALITSISKETRAAIRVLIVRSIAEGIPPYDLARLIRTLIGLNAPQVQAAAAYRVAMINAGHTSERVNWLLEKYTRKKIRERAVTIARTEVMGALNRGSELARQEMKREGLLSNKAVEEWIATPDEKACPVCSKLDGKRVPLGTKFPNAGLRGRPPAHPRCRCTTAVLDDPKFMPKETVAAQQRAKKVKPTTRKKPLSKPVKFVRRTRK